MTHTNGEPRWVRMVQMLLHGLYLPLIGLLVLLGVWRGYNSLPAEGVLDAANVLILLIPIAAVTATALRTRWRLRLIVLAAPYVWAIGVTLVWAIAACLQ